MEVYLMTNITYYTRSNDGQIHDHFENISSALEYFTSDTGYRLDFIFPDGRVLFIYRSDYWEDVSTKDIKTFSESNYSLAKAKIMLYNPNSQDIPDNVIKVNF